MGVLCALLALVAAAHVSAQPGRWDAQDVTYGGVAKFGARVAVDRWGHQHIIWAQQAIWGLKGLSGGQPDPSRSGIQIFYTNDATGRFSAPVQATDTTSGTVYLKDSVGVPWAFKLDRYGSAHIAYLANAGGHAVLFYGTNADTSTRRFSRLEGIFTLPPTTDTLGFDMAIDSVGSPHIVWIDRSKSNGEAELYLWPSREYDEGRPLVTLPCPGGVTGCSVGTPRVEVSPDGRLFIAVRTFFGSNGGAIYLLRQRPDGIFGPMRWLQAFPDGGVLNGPGRRDLRLGMAVDSVAGLHMILPYIDAPTPTRRSNRILYIYSDPDDTTINTPTSLTGESQVLVDLLESVPGDLDISYNGGNRISIGWVTRKTGAAAKIGYAELGPRPAGMHTSWERKLTVVDVTPKLAMKKSWHDQIRISANGEHLALAGTIDPDAAGPSRAIPQVATIVRSSTAPRIQYILPDVAASGMNVVVEAYANPKERGSFGVDGYHGDTVQLTLSNRSDTSRVVLGPTVISWDGRLASTMIFVKPGAALGPVPLRLQVGSAFSNMQPFEIVATQHMGDANGILSGGGVLGSGGGYGTRSKRGVMVVDSLVLRSGSYTVDTVDLDPDMPGNQGFLPVTILSRGPVRIDSGATLTVSASNLTQERKTVAGPGGGGGGTGGSLAAGSGYTGGGGIVSANGGSLFGASVGSGSLRSGFMNGGGALNGAPGGASYVDAPGGGGTGHPFGAAGLFGQTSPTEPVGRNPGGAGGGTGGVGLAANGLIGGGGAGHGGPGFDGVDITGDRDVNGDGGMVVGSRHLVPIAGGSGGGGGGYKSGGLSTGGSGGGAIAIVSYNTIQINGAIEANGSDGTNFSNALSAGGGGGAGGGIILAAQGTLALGRQGAVRAMGGLGGPASNGGVRGGDGGNGRIRVDGKMTAAATASITPAPNFIGPGNAMSTVAQAQVGTVITGYGTPDSVLRIFKRAEWGGWRSTMVTVGRGGIWRDTLGVQDVLGGKLYVVAMQRVTNPSRTEFTYEPSWVMSPAGANIFGRVKMRIEPDSIAFTCIRYDSCAFADVTIENQGEMSDLLLSDIKIVGPGARAFRVESGLDGVTIGAGGSRTLRVFFCPGDTGRFEAELVLGTNAGAQEEKHIGLTGCGTSGRLLSSMIDIELGTICVNDCRDTVITFRNTGNAVLTLDSIASDAANLSVAVNGPKLPITLKPGESRNVAINLCMRRFDDAGMVMVVRNHTIDSVLIIRVHGINGAPMPELPAAIDFGAVNPGDVDPCAVREFEIRNLNASIPMRLKSADLSSTNFTIVDAPVGGVIAPGSAAKVRLRFCSGAEGMFDGLLHLTFEGDPCSLDTVIALHGVAALERARYVVTRPDTSSRELPFAPTLVGATSPEETIIISNVGGVRGGAINLIMTNGAEFLLSATSIPAIDPGRSETLKVRMKPIATGDRTGRIDFMSADPTWSDFVNLTGRGTRAGLQIAPVVVNFGDVCIGDKSATREIVVYNTGSAPGRVESASTGDPHFVVERSSKSLPAYVLVADATKDTLRLAIHFAASGEGTISSDLVIVTDSGEQRVRLIGKGVTGHVSARETSLTFGCDDTVKRITLTNDGACAMEVRQIREMTGGASFRLDPSHIFPQTIAAHESREFLVHYAAGNDPVDGALEVESIDPAHLTAPVRSTIALHGDVCGGGDVQKLTFIIRNANAVVGDTFSLPVELKTAFQTSAKLTYTLTITYAEDLLIPRLAPRKDAPAVSNWMASTTTSWIEDPPHETSPGTLVVKGVIDAHTPPGTSRLLNIPFKVLFGSTHRTDVTVASIELSPPDGIALGKQNGVFTALDCDTTGNIAITGSYALDQNNPNPFNPSTLIRYRIANRERVRLNLYDAMGNFVRVLLDEEQDAGQHEFRLDAAGMSSGIYTYEIVSGRFKKTRRMVLLE